MSRDNEGDVLGSAAVQDVIFCAQIKSTSRSPGVCGAEHARERRPDTLPRVFPHASASKGPFDCLRFRRSWTDKGLHAKRQRQAFSRSAHKRPMTSTAVSRLLLVRRCKGGRLKGARWVNSQWCRVLPEVAFSSRAFDDTVERIRG
jgi:hypothetical protein